MKSLEKNKNFFCFKQFSVKHEKSAMKVGFDGILLGAWCDTYNDVKVLDVGTGTGLIALMIAQKNIKAKIYAVEPDLESYNEASYNFDKSPWRNRLKIDNLPLQNYAPNVEFAHIVCNPPFFNSGSNSPLPDRAKARHTIDLSHDELLQYSARILKPRGKLSVILPLKEGNDFVEKAKKYNLALSRLWKVFTKTKIERLLIELIKGSIFIPEMQLLKIYDDSGGYSSEYKKLTGDYYLNIHL